MCPLTVFSRYSMLVVILLLIRHSTFVGSVTFLFNPNNITVHMHDNFAASYEVLNLNLSEPEQFYEIYSKEPHIASVDKIIISSVSPDGFQGTFNISANFLGETMIKVKNKNTNKDLSEELVVVVVREIRVIDTVFTASVATLVAVIYVNFGCAVNWGELKNLVKRPIGPAIGFCGQFIIMPLLSYFIGYIIFPEYPEMRLGMFFAGVSPAGGASNIWTAILEGNIDLSILMTTISTISAFGMMPLWIFTLGKNIFEQANLEVPYSQISTYVVALVLPLAIGYLIQRYLKRIGNFLARILKGFSSLLILVIVIFAIITNLYLFELFSWRIIIAGMGLPYLGYILGYILALLFKQQPKDCLAIAIETGIQNTGISIFLLRFALPQPQADLTTVIPVSVAIMTPFPLIFLYVYKKIKLRYFRIKSDKIDTEPTTLSNS